MDFDDDTSEQTVRWYVATTHPNQEHIAVENLRRQGFVSLCPLIWKAVKVGRRVIRRRSAAFPGYVFVYLNPSAVRWRSINGTRGVRAAITDANGPIPVRAGVVETLVESMDKDGCVQFSLGLHTGDTARLLSGPFGGQLGVIENLDSAGRVRLLISLLGRSTRVEVMATEVAPGSV